MRAIEIILKGKIWWRVPLSMTVSPTITALGGWCIASPLAANNTNGMIGSISIAINAHTPADIPLPELPDGTVLISTDHLVLTSDDSTDVLEDTVEVAQCVVRYLNALRVISQQPELPRSVICMSSIMKLDSINQPNGNLNTTRDSRVQKYIADSGLTLQHILDADNAIMCDSVPVHGELANDAAEAIIRTNYRSAIIFAAAAIESCAGSVLDREYDKLLNSSVSSGEYRCVTVKVNQKETITKDPVYDALRNSTGDSGSHFLTLLHECPLYLLKRSLKYDDPEVYRQAHALYRTRNNLAHTGTTDVNKSGLLDVDYDGAMIALTVANAVLAWFGEKGTSIPKLEFV